MTDTTDKPVADKIQVFDDTTLTTAQLRELGVSVPPGGKIDPKDKIPGLELTWEMVRELKMDPFEGPRALQALKREHPRSKLILIPTEDNNYVFRTCSTQEWSLFVRTRGDVTKKRDEAIAAGEPAHAVEQKLRDMWMEAVLAQFSVLPKLTVDQIRDGLLPGEMVAMFETYSAALGFNQQLAMLKL